MIKKAMLFAAGRGERLRPLTDQTPKCLLPIGEKPILDYSLAYLKKYGIEEVVVNLWHLGNKIKAHAGDGKKYGLRVIYSEEKELLGTGGGLKKAEGHFKNETAFLTLNSDTILNCDLNELAAFHAEHNATATLVVAPWEEGCTRVQMGNNRLLNLGVGDHLFTGLAVWSPAIFEKLSLEPSNLITTAAHSHYRTIALFLHEGLWLDIGTPQKYQEAQDCWAAGHFSRTVSV